jgi:RNA polymerase sigma-70 factor (ECF subfamily)
MDLHTTELLGLLGRLREGDREAADELLRRCVGRLTTIAHTMLRQFPAVAAREQTVDVVQEAAVSLLSALKGLPIADTRAFFGLAAEHVRRRLYDLARKHRRRPVAVPLPNDPDVDIARWEALHEAAEKLPGELREVFSLRFYHGCSLAEAASVLGLSDSTARRRWLEAAAELAAALQDLPRVF